MCMVGEWAALLKKQARLYLLEISAIEIRNCHADSALAYAFAQMPQPRWNMLAHGPSFHTRSQSMSLFHAAALIPNS